MPIVCTSLNTSARLLDPDSRAIPTHAHSSFLGRHRRRKRSFRYCTLVEAKLGRFLHQEDSSLGLLDTFHDITTIFDKLPANVASEGVGW